MTNSAVIAVIAITGIVGTTIPNPGQNVKLIVNQCQVPWKINLKITYTFPDGDVKVAGTTGRAVLQVVAIGEIVPGAPPFVSWDGNIVFVSATGGLEGLHGQGSAQANGLVPFSPTYVINTHFHP